MTQSPQTPELQQPGPHNGGDCLPLTADAPPSGKPARISRQRLQHIADTLHDRSLQALRFLAQHRFATSKHLASHLRCFYTSERSATRQVARLMRYLAGLGLVGHLARRIGGQRAGSSGLIWYLSEPGHRLLNLTDSATQPHRRRPSEPSAAFLTHTLMITEIRTLIESIARATRLSIHSILTEPHCWQHHLGTYGHTEWVKPDLALVTEIDGYQDHWWIEVDLGTEHPGRINRKISAYLRHYQSGQQQQTHGVFPETIWITTTHARTAQLDAIINDRPDVPQGMFTVCQPDYLWPTLLRQ